MWNRVKTPFAAILLFIVIISVLRLSIIGGFPMSPDEAYYWTWSRHLDVCYYDQPGMVAWVDRLFSMPWPGSTAFSIRIAAVLLSALTTLILFQTYREYRDDDREALAFAAGFSLLPFSWLAGIIMIHDTSLLPWQALSYLAIFRLARNDGRAADWFLLAIALTGAMYAKFSAVMMAWGLLAYMLWSPKARRWWKTWPPYAAGLAASLLYLPVIIWNYRHGWISVRAVQELTDSDIPSLTRRLGFMAEYLLSQVAIFYPLIGIVVFAALVKGVAAAVRNPGDDRTVLPVCLSIPVLAYFFVQSLKSHVFGNWPGVVYIPLFMLAVSEVAAVIRRGPNRSRLDRAALILVVSGLVLNLITLAVFTIHLEHRTFRPVLAKIENRLGLEKKIDWRLDMDFGGWMEMAELVESSARPSDFILARRYQVASMLEFMLPGQPAVYCYNAGQRGNQWDLWPGLAELAGKDALFIDIRRMPAEVRERFESVVPIHTPFIVGDPDNPVKKWCVYRGIGWKGPIGKKAGASDHPR